MRPWVRVALAIFAIGWGANQFSPLLLVYRGHGGLSEGAVNATFSAYAAGLIPALLLAAALSDRAGRQRVMRPVLVLSGAASVVLLLGGHTVWVLALGRLLAGAASGAAFGPGSAWIKELSGDAGPGGGARRAAIALSAGFGGGPFVAGVLAQWVPAPQVVPYLVHIALIVVIAPLAWNAPETVAAGQRRTARRAGPPTTLRHPDFLRKIMPVAPLVFGTATVSFAFLPEQVPLHGPGVAISGGIAGLTLASGMAVQPLARRLARHSADSMRYFGLAAGTLGFLLAAATVRFGEPLLLVPVAAALGAAYGMLLVSGLSHVEALASPDDLASVTAVFYCLAYLGFVAPYVLTALTEILSPTVLFVLVAGVVALLIPVTMSRRGKRESGPACVSRSTRWPKRSICEGSD